MVASFHPPKPLPASSLGQRLEAIFGRQTWDFIEAPSPASGDKPQWLTVTDYPLRPRILFRRWQDPDVLIGVRFASQTLYGVLDIDAASPYCNVEAIANIRAALETIGITRTLLVRSSFSNGLHLYMPLPELVKTFDLAVALHECLKAQDFTLTNGTLETFPNPKPYGVEKIIHYNGHRLPLQPGTGSCLLDEDLQPVGDRLNQFLGLWDQAAAQQDMDELLHALKIGRDNYRQKPRRDITVSRKADAWRQDMELELAEGWTGPGQTNHLLKTIACHAHVFLQLVEADLITHTLAVATQLPGYQQYCRHQHEIECRVRAWCKSVQNYYWPFGSDPKRDTQTDLPPTPSVNEQRAEDARQRIQRAMAALDAADALPAAITRRAEALMQQARIAKQTLYRPANLPLWHPHHHGVLQA